MTDIGYSVTQVIRTNEDVHLQKENPPEQEMSPSTITVLVLAGIVHCANGLFGSNVCFEQQK